MIYGIILLLNLQVDSQVLLCGFFFFFLVDFETGELYLIGNNFFNGFHDWGVRAAVSLCVFED